MPMHRAHRVVRAGSARALGGVVLASRPGRGRRRDAHHSRHGLAKDGEHDDRQEQGATAYHGNSFAFYDPGGWGAYRPGSAGRLAGRAYNRQLPMSRVVYTETTSTDAQRALREQHRLRVVTADEEGGGVDALPDGVYGFTYSPGLVAAPLFAAKRFRNYETHKRFDGETYLLGFVTEGEAVRIAANTETVSVEVHPDPTTDAATLVALPYVRLKKNRQHAAPNQESVSVTVVPA
jgi:hypothetical protein